jgi:hypothetical protein
VSCILYFCYNWVSFSKEYCLHFRFSSYGNIHSVQNWPVP